MYRQAKILSVSPDSEDKVTAISPRPDGVGVGGVIAVTAKGYISFVGEEGVIDTKVSKTPISYTSAIWVTNRIAVVGLKEGKVQEWFVSKTGKLRPIRGLKFPTRKSIVGFVQDHNDCKVVPYTVAPLRVESFFTLPVVQIINNTTGLCHIMLQRNGDVSVLDSVDHIQQKLFKRPSGFRIPATKMALTENGVGLIADSEGKLFPFEETYGYTGSHAKVCHEACVSMEAEGTEIYMAFKDGLVAKYDGSELFRYNLGLGIDGSTRQGDVLYIARGSHLFVIKNPYVNFGRYPLRFHGV